MAVVSAIKEELLSDLTENLVPKLFSHLEKYLIKNNGAEGWLRRKFDAPLGQLPYLEVKGKKLPQSQAISRFLAHEFGLFGKSKVETATIDAMTEALRDLEKPLTDWYHAKDETKKAELKKELYEQKAPTLLKILEKQLSLNNEGSGWFVGESITLADISFFDWVGWLTFGNPDVLADYPKLKGLHGRVKAYEPIAAWLAKRPETEF
ncbi:S-crystallin SL11-like [Anneissia japonica]|uniref:S-crystallin SL11-like n=1 Tax=Anneissia japonica TaxID=1529436 RepID=UPI001425A94F|nr:S-crystallin SL11-like [Anneissia japonica]